MRRVLLVGTCASGTTALTKCFLQRQDTEVLSQVLKSYVERGEPIAYESFYGRTENPQRVLFNKETLGYREAALCESPLFEERHLLDTDNYFLFIFRNPVGVWHSWRRRGWDIEVGHLIRSYKWLYRSYEHSRKSRRSKALLFDSLGEGIQDVLIGICDFCGIDYNENMVRWEQPWGTRRGGNTGNPDIDTYETFSEERIRKACIVPIDGINKYIEKQIGQYWSVIRDSVRVSWTG